MTALKEFARLESEGLWRADPKDQRIGVVLSFGEATLVISDTAGRAISHWSLPAVDRINPGTLPAIFSPDGEATETVEISDELMIDAIEKVRLTIKRAKPRPGRLRNAALLVLLAALLLASVFWLPGALVRQAQSVVPPVKRSEIGAALLGHIQRLTGPSCRSERGASAIARLHRRVLGPAADGQVFVVPGGPEQALYLPGGIIILNRDLVENTEDPAVVAGHILAAATQRLTVDPLESLLTHAGPGTTFRLLTTGELNPDALRDYAEHVIVSPPSRPSDDLLVTQFELANVPTSPFAYFVDITGESTLGLIEADPFAGQAAPPLLQDSEWISLQGICN